MYSKIVSLSRRAVGLYKEEGFGQLLRSIPGKIELTIRDLYATMYLLRLKNSVGDDLILKEIQGSKMYIDLGNPRISYHLTKHGIWEKDTTEWLKEYLEEGMTVIDIGANMGYFALIEAQAIGKRGKVHAIEPDPRNTKLLEKNIEINGLDNVHIYPVAISDQNGTAKFYLANSSNNNSLVGLYQRSIEVNTFRLDDFLDEKGIDKDSIDLIRMDIEGYEAKALEGMIETLKASKSLKLFIEIHPQLIGFTGYSTQWIFETLNSYGFKLKNRGKNYVFEKV